MLLQLLLSFIFYMAWGPLKWYDYTQWSRCNPTISLEYVLKVLKCFHLTDIGAVWIHNQQCSVNKMASHFDYLACTWPFIIENCNTKHLFCCFYEQFLHKVKLKTEGIYWFFPLFYRRDLNRLSSRNSATAINAVLINAVQGPSV